MVQATTQTFDETQPEESTVIRLFSETKLFCYHTLDNGELLNRYLFVATLESSLNATRSYHQQCF